jgi:hypothetical protein
VRRAGLSIDAFATTSGGTDRFAGRIVIVDTASPSGRAAVTNAIYIDAR